MTMAQRFYFSVKVSDPKWVISFNMTLNVVKDFLPSTVFSNTTRNVWMTAMLERIQSDATLPRTASVSVISNRADLVVTPAPASSELREKAVPPVGQAQRSTTEVDVVNVSFHAVSLVRDGFQKVQRSEADLKELERLYEKLLPGYKALKDKMEAPDVIQQAEQAAQGVDAFLMKRSAPQVGHKAEASVEELQTSSDRERTLARIESALLKVSALRNKLTDDRTSTHEALLNINASVSDLNMARMQVSDDKVMASLASSACEAIMTNVRSVVVAHGNVSPDLVRLILN